MYPNTNLSYYQPQPTIALKGRPVSSFEEARAMPIDFDGTTFFFPDLANKRIYTKQINLDGTALLNMYELKEIPVEPTKDFGNFVTREELEQTLIELKKSLAPAGQAASTQTPQAQSAPAPGLSKIF